MRRTKSSIECGNNQNKLRIKLRNINSNRVILKLRSRTSATNRQCLNRSASTLNNKRIFSNSFYN